MTDLHGARVIPIRHRADVQLANRAAGVEGPHARQGAQAQGQPVRTIGEPYNLRFILLLRRTLRAVRQAMVNGQTDRI